METNTPKVDPALEHQLFRGLRQNLSNLHLYRKVYKEREGGGPRVSKSDGFQTWPKSRR